MRAHLVSVERYYWRTQKAPAGNAHPVARHRAR
jgi:hypothetical protein